MARWGKLFQPEGTVRRYERWGCIQWVSTLWWACLCEFKCVPHLIPSTLAWKIPWTEEPDRLQSVGSQRVAHDWATSLSLSSNPHHSPAACSLLLSHFTDGKTKAEPRQKGINSPKITNLIGNGEIYSNFSPVDTLYEEGNGTPLQYSCLENPMDRGAW